MGCLNFGPDEETTEPTEAQISRCQKAMYLNPSIPIQVQGFKLLGSGIDDAIWFKFMTPTQDIKDLFRSTVDINTFEPKFNFSPSSLNNPHWWDPDAKNLIGGNVSLPQGRYMSVGIQAQEAGLLVYIFWHET